MIVAVPAEDIVPAVAVKFALEAPADTVTELGTETRALLLDSETEAPPLGAAPESVTVQVVDCPEPRLLGLHDKPDTEMVLDGVNVTNALADFVESA